MLKMIDGKRRQKIERERMVMKMMIQNRKKEKKVRMRMKKRGHAERLNAKLSVKRKIRRKDKEVYRKLV